jgi:hypothetical protein
MILEAARYLKQAGFVLPEDQPKKFIPDAPRLYIAVVTTEITARSGTTAGKGKATLRYIPGVPGTATTISNFPPTGVNDVDVYNVVQTAIAVGKYIFVSRENASGKFVAILEDCGA